MEDIAGQIREQEINVMSFATVNTRVLAECFAEYVESLEDVTAMVSTVLDKLGMKMDYEAKYRFVNEIHDAIGEEKMQKEKISYFGKGR